MNKEKIKQYLKSFYFSFFWLMALIFIIDIISKWTIQNNLKLGDAISVIPNFFYIVLVHNTGMAFGLGADGDIGWRIFFICISVIIGGGLLAYYIVKRKTLSTWLKVALSLMIAGAIGNLIDRAFYWDATVGFNGVIDWLQFYIFGKAFAVFNIADASLVVGTIILIIVLIIDSIKEAKQNAKKEKETLSKEDIQAITNNDKRLQNNVDTASKEEKKENNEDNHHPEGK
jgi:signal peptidase II